MARGPADPTLDRLTASLSRSSSRLRVFAVITAAICFGLAVVPFFDPTLWASGLGWQIGFVVYVVFMVGVALFMLYGAFFKVQRKARQLKRTLRSEPQRIVSLRPMVARAVPIVHWEPDDGSAVTGLHIFIEDDRGTVWVLPVTRSEMESMLDDLTVRCPGAKVG